MIGNFAGRGAQLLFMFASSVVLAWQLGPAGLGVYAVALAAVRLALIPAVEGFARLAEREIAGAHADGDGGVARAASRFAAIGGAGSAAALGAATYAALVSGAFGDSVAGAGVASLAVATLVAETAAGVLRGLVRGCGRTTDAVIALNLTAALLPLAFLAYPLMGGAMRPEAALALRCGVVVAMLPVWIGLVRRAWPPAFADAPAARVPRGWMGESAQFALLGAVQAGLTEVGMLMIGAFASDAEAGQFRIATRVYVLASFAALAVRMATGPRIALAWRKGERARIEEEARRLATLATLFAAAATLGFAAAGRPLLALAFGAEFTAAYGPALVLCAAALLGAGAALSGVILRMSGRQRWVIVGSLAGLAAVVGLNLVLTPATGAYGGAIAFVAGVGLSQAIYVAASIRQLGVNPLLTVPKRDVFRI